MHRFLKQHHISVSQSAFLPVMTELEILKAALGGVGGHNIEQYTIFQDRDQETTGGSINRSTLQRSHLTRDIRKGHSSSFRFVPCDLWPLLVWLIEGCLLSANCLFVLSKTSTVLLYSSFFSSKQPLEHACLSGTEWAKLPRARRGVIRLINFPTPPPSGKEKNGSFLTRLGTNQIHETGFIITTQSDQYFNIAYHAKLLHKRKRWCYRVEEVDIWNLFDIDNLLNCSTKSTADDCVVIRFWYIRLTLPSDVQKKKTFNENNCLVDGITVICRFNL